MNEPSHHEHNHGIVALPDESPEQMRSRLVKSSSLRFISSIVQIAAGATTGNYPLIVEGAEEFSDGVAYAAGAKEIRAEEHNDLVRRARGRTVGAAVVAASLSTFGVVDDIASDHNTWTKPMEGLDFAHNDIRAATLAVVLSSLVLYINRKSIKSDKPLDKFIFIDSVKDFFIPSCILGLSALSSTVLPIPHYGEYIFEATSAGIGWWNTNKLRNLWLKTRNKTRS